MDEAAQGAQRPDSKPELGEDALSTAGQLPPANNLSYEEEEELRGELAKVEEEIQTLSQVLQVKERQVADIKRKLGITPLNELKQNLSKSWQEVTTSTAYKKTSETLSQAGQKATAAFSSVGSAITRKLEDVKNTPTFKSFEEKVETIKTKITPPASAGDFGEVLTSTASSDPVEPQTESLLAEGAHPH